MPTIKEKGKNVRKIVRKREYIYSTALYKKKLSGPMQLKPCLLFKGQPYVILTCHLPLACKLSQGIIIFCSLLHLGATTQGDH